MGFFSRKKKTTKVKENPYYGLRQMAFNTSMKQLRIEFESDELRIYSVIVE